MRASSQISENSYKALHKCKCVVRTRFPLRYTYKYIPALKDFCSFQI